MMLVFISDKVTNNAGSSYCYYNDPKKVVQRSLPLFPLYVSWAFGIWSFHFLCVYNSILSLSIKVPLFINISTKAFLNLSLLIKLKLKAAHLRRP